MPKMISKRVSEVLEKRLNVKSKLPPVILYLKDRYGRCFIKNHGLALTRMSFKSQKTMYNYLETVYHRNDIHYIYWDEDFETED